ncbi:MAG: hypothetical protein NAG76_19005 [Candidatus Pristimantibacillus lignocellulolyticus]|uniref:Beta-ketoacyl-[acyl-carrier-protein] synthase III N-terminal domain-containing protein n=1 Tax=Candidatus Pristimantibacillus lignocellulolyticus TaxID=2994561 RepID=A0A9J6ZCZ9_9BACL|nr:MAG: hypothetical protein NAG76_19005 [Candidatus Pristimantibacillus lignocellulolyticus]
MGELAQAKPLNVLMNKKVYFSISDFSNYIPEQQFSVQDGVELLRKQGMAITEEQVEAFQKKYGFRHAPFETKLTMEEMIIAAITPILNRNSIPIQTILFVNGGNWNSQHNLFKKIIQTYGLQHTNIYSIGKQTCASFHMALRMATNLFSSNPDQGAILIVSADKLSGSSHKLTEFYLCGDSATACLLTRSGEGHKTYEVFNQDGYVYDESNLEGLALFNTTFFLGIRGAIQSILKQANLSLGDVKLIIGSNVSLVAWETVALLLRAPLEKFYVKTSEVGHLPSSDIQYNLQQAIADGSIVQGDFYITINVGYGGFMGCGLHQY